MDLLGISVELCWCEPATKINYLLVSYYQKNHHTYTITTDDFEMNKLLSSTFHVINFILLCFVMNFCDSRIIF